VRELDQKLQKSHAPAQFVVLTPEQLRKRFAAHNDAQVVDNR
jgi:hypothetical protein